MKNKYILITLGIILIGGFVYYFWPYEQTPEPDGFIGWEKFGLNETYQVGDFIPVQDNRLKSPVVTSKFLRSKFANANDLLEIQKDNSFESKRVDYTSTFSASINANAVSFDFKNTLKGLKRVNFDVFGGMQKRLANGTVVLSQIVRDLPDEAVEDIKLSLERHDSIIFITEVMQYDSSKYQISWAKELSPTVKSSIEGDLQTLGTNGNWKSDKGYVIVSKQPKNFLYKFEPMNKSLKEIIFRKNEVIVQARNERTKNLDLIAAPIHVSDWSSGRIDGKSWRFENVNATLDSKGILNLDGRQSSNRWEGFTASIRVTFLDVNQKPIESIVTSPSGVNGKDTRMFRQTLVVDSQTAIATESIKIEAIK